MLAFLGSPTRTRLHLGLARALALALAIGVTAWSARADGNETVADGGLITQPGNASITDTMLSQWISQALGSDPNGNNPQVLLVLNECFGGNVATAFENQQNTAVISASSPNQPASNSGFPTATANSLTPGNNNTAASVFQAGQAANSGPGTPWALGPATGNLDPAQFSLAPVNTANGPIKSRHVIYYAGQPDDKDPAYANTIAENFGDTSPGTTTASTQDGTTVTTVGDSASSQNAGVIWNAPGTPNALKTAINTAVAAIKNSGHPKQEQFILVVGDHGGLSETQKRTAIVPAGARSPITNTGNTGNNPSENTGLRCFQSGIDLQPSDLVTPSFTVFVNLSLAGSGANSPLPTSQLSSIFSSWSLDAVVQTGANAGFDLQLSDPNILPLNLDGDTTIGNTPGEGVELEYSVAPSLMTSSFFDDYVELDITQNTGLDWQVSDPSQDSGPVFQVVPEPDSHSLLGLGLGLCALLRRRRTAKA